MSRYKSLHRHFRTILKPGYPPCNDCVTYSPKSSFLSTFFRSLHVLSPQIDEGIGVEASEAKKKKRLYDTFKETVGLSQVVANSENESENGDSEVKRKLRELERSIKKLKSNSKTEEIPQAKDLSIGEPMKLSALFAPRKGHLKKPEERREEPSVRKKPLFAPRKGHLRKPEERREGPSVLSALFAPRKGHLRKPEERREEPSVRKKPLFAPRKGHLKKPEERREEPSVRKKPLFAPRKGHLKKPEERREEPSVCKKLSPDMEEFVRHLYVEGYFNKANIFPDKKLDFSCFKTSYGRGFIKFAAEHFGRDKQEIAKSLSCSDLKKIVLFGCPSLERKRVFAAKSLRKFFEIQEDTVCSKCVLKHSCQFPNQSVWKSKDSKNLNLSVVMKVISLYALESVHPQLTIPDDVKTSASRLLKEILKLSQTVS